MNRLRVIQALFAGFFLLITIRLVYWQLIKSPDLKEQARLQHSSSIEVSSPRGEIKSSDGNSLAASVDRFLFYINPKEFPKDKINDVSTLLVSSDSARQTLKASLNSNSLWKPILKSISPLEKNLIEKLEIPGVGFEPQPGRSYPESTSSAHLLGFVGRDSMGQSQGYFGLEGFYNRELSGKSGYILQERDAFNRPIAIGRLERILPKTGHTLVTSIDRTVQYIIFNALEKGLTKYQAESGTVSIMDPVTGRVLGMTSIPGFDPSRYTDYPPQLYKNPVISDSYEPGSTFKTIVMASALDAGVVTPETTCPCTGPVTIGDAVISSWNNKYFPNSTTTDIILHSDNVGMVFVGRRLGESKILTYLQKFGFGKPTGVDLQEESVLPLRAEGEWHEIDWSTVTFGQGIAVTPLQMLRAVSAIANLGKLPTPHIVTQIGTKKIPDPKPVQIISPKAAAQMTQMMVNGVNNGEVRYYKPKGFVIAGKTGTAQIPIAGHYDSQKVISSFIGFAPADKPKFIMLVTLHDPKSSPWGSTTAAPLWFDIARDLFRYYGIAPYN